MKMIGYLINTGTGPNGERGLAYDYIIAGDGVWLDAHNNHLSVLVPAAKGQIKGVPPLSKFQYLILRHGKIPQRFFDLAISVMVARPEKEVYVAIAWGGSGYQLVIPEQEGGGARVEYNTPDNIVCELHSHGKMGAFFLARRAFFSTGGDLSTTHLSPSSSITFNGPSSLVSFTM